MARLGSLSEECRPFGEVFDAAGRLTGAEAGTGSVVGEFRCRDVRGVPALARTGGDAR